MKASKPPAKPSLVEASRPVFAGTPAQAAADFHQLASASVAPPPVRAPRVMADHQPPHRQRDWVAMALSTILALGFSSAFLGPLWWPHQAPTVAEAEPGVVLGESLSKALAVTVSVQLPSDTQVITVQPTNGSVAQALAQAAAARKTTLTYFTRGSGIYLDSFFGRVNGAGGWWKLSLNDQPIVDLNSSDLTQGDQLQASWEPLIF